MFGTFIRTVLEALWLFVIIPLLLMVANVLVGAISGWFVGLFFGDTILGILSQIGICDVSMWQVGAFIGFVAGFFTKLMSFNTKKR